MIIRLKGEVFIHTASLLSPHPSLLLTKRLSFPFPLIIIGPILSFPPKEAGQGIDRYPVQIVDIDPGKPIQREARLENENLSAWLYVLQEHIYQDDGQWTLRGFLSSRIIRWI